MDKTILLLKEALKAKLGGKIKSWYIGDPVLIPDSAMPCIYVSPNSSTITVADNQRDSRIHKIDIAIVIDARKYFGSTPSEMVGTTFLMENMSKENDDGTIDAATVLGVIRDNMSLSLNRFVVGSVSIDYSTRMRTADLITLEAICTIEIEHFSNR